MAVNVVWSSMALILTFFYTDVYGLKASDIALLMLLPRLIDAFADMAMGMITDKHVTRMGRYGLPAAVLRSLWPLCHARVHDAPTWRITQINVGLPDLYPDDARFHIRHHPLHLAHRRLDRRPAGAAVRERLPAFFSQVAAFLVTIIVPLLAARWGVNHLARGYQISMALMAGMAHAAVPVLLFHHHRACENHGKPLSLQLRLLFRNDQWVVLALVCVIGTIGYVGLSPRFVGSLLRKIFPLQQPPRQPGGAVAISFDPLSSRRMAAAAPRVTRCCFPTFLLLALSPRSLPWCRFHVDHQALLQSAALPLEPDHHSRAQPHSIFRR